jgi:hypothetical protein
MRIKRMRREGTSEEIRERREMGREVEETES